MSGELKARMSWGWQRAFAKHDADNSGSLEVAEVHEALKELGMHANLEAKEIMQQYDTDGDGTLNEAEFGQLVQKLKESGLVQEPSRLREVYIRMTVKRVLQISLKEQVGCRLMNARVPRVLGSE